MRGIMLVFAGVPLAAGVALGYQEIDEALAERSEAAAVQTQVDELVQLTELRASLIDERNMASAVTTLSIIGFDPELVSLIAGVDVLSERDAAAARVDELIVDSEFADRMDHLAEVRAISNAIDIVDEEDLSEAGRLYTDFEIEIGAAVDARLDELLDDAGRISSTSELINSLRVFSASTSFRAATSNSSTAALAVYFDLPGLDGRTALAELTGESFRADGDLALIRRIADDDSNALAEMESFLDLPSTESFSAVVRDLTNSGGVEPLSFEDVSERLDELLVVFSDGNASVAASFDVVTAAGADVDDAVDALKERAQSGAMRVAISVIIGALVAIGLSFVLIRFIVRPLDRLAEGAQRIRDGDLDQRIPDDGPVEIRGAALALNEATSSLEHFRHQTDALARGEVSAVVDGDDSQVGALGESIRAAVDTLAESISARDELREQLLHEASHDGLTQLANRRASLDKLRAAVASPWKRGNTAVLFVDLDGFKSINDHHGHRAGDVALRIVASRLGSAVGPDAHVGRLGGDEFIVIIEEVPTPAVAVGVGERIIEAVCVPIDVDGTSLALSASVGVSLDDGRGVTAQAMLHEADVAVYEAKRAGSGIVRVCDEAMRTEIERSARLESELRRALHSDEFELWLQPVVDVEGLVESSREALIRWRHPERGLVMPGDFIEFAERSDLIIDIDRWVLLDAARVLAADPDGTPIAVNVSGRHLTSESFVHDVIAPLRAHDVDPSRIVVEVTESSVLDDLGRAADHLDQLRELGVLVAIDDFGTGYASLSYLRQLPVDIIKIDRSFTRDEESQSLVSMVVETARLLDLTVTAEGVEDEQQVDTLRRLGVDRLQGYHFGRPRPPARPQVAADGHATGSVGAALPPEGAVAIDAPVAGR
ncbi:MAG: EAL domain-containing protein [Actinomycetota bacterium]